MKAVQVIKNLATSLLVGALGGVADGRLSRGRDQRWEISGKRHVRHRFGPVFTMYRAQYVDRSRYADLRKASVPGGRRRAGKKREAARATV